MKTIHLFTSLALILLGTGNMLYGTLRYQEAIEIYSEIKVNSKEFIPESSDELRAENISYYFSNDQKATDAAHPEKLANKTIKRSRKNTHRLRFYKFVIKGGQIITCFGTIYLLISCIFLNKPSSSTTIEPK